MAKRVSSRRTPPSPRCWSNWGFSLGSSPSSGTWNSSAPRPRHLSTGAGRPPRNCDAGRGRLTLAREGPHASGCPQWIRQPAASARASVEKTHAKRLGSSPRLLTDRLVIARSLRWVVGEAHAGDRHARSRIASVLRLTETHASGHTLRESLAGTDKSDASATQIARFAGVPVSSGPSNWPGPCFLRSRVERQWFSGTRSSRDIERPKSNGNGYGNCARWRDGLIPPSPRQPPDREEPSQRNRRKEPLETTERATPETCPRFPYVQRHPLPTTAASDPCRSPARGPGGCAQWMVSRRRWRFTWPSRL